MSGALSSTVAWFSHLEPVRPVEDVFRRPDDPRLGELIEPWHGQVSALQPGRAVLVGFPQDEGIRRNHGRTGAAEAPHEIRACLGRLTPYDPSAGVDLGDLPPLDAGNVRIAGKLEATQELLGEVIREILETGAVPVVLGGGHETAYGHYLGYVLANRPVGVINLDAHLDVRPCLVEGGHSGSPFRQALEHPTHPLPAGHYVCLGAQPFAVSRQHWDYAQARGCVVHWADQLKDRLTNAFAAECTRLEKMKCQVHVSVDADAICMNTVPGVSAPNPTGLSGVEVAHCARLAGWLPGVGSFELVEVNPQLDRDRQSSRWAALVIWQFLIGLAERRSGR